MKMIRRVERLERAMGVGVDPDWPTEIVFKYISPVDHSVVGTHVLKIEPPPRQFSQRGVNRLSGRRRPR